jgi:hypothetical protein
MRERQADRSFPERFNMKMPAGMRRALGEVAARRHTTPSELVRQALLTEIAAAGVKLSEPEKIHA